MEILLGAGSSRIKKLTVPGREDWDGLVTVDFNDAHKPDIVHDLTVVPLPFADDVADEIHAYEVMEHLGQQGDFKAFFAQFSDYWRILKPGGLFFGTSPATHSRWLWGDPGHTRVIQFESLIFLRQTSYAAVGNTPMSDYRFCYQADFDIVHSAVKDETYCYVLRAVKPSRIAA